MLATRAYQQSQSQTQIINKVVSEDLSGFRHAKEQRNKRKKHVIYCIVVLPGGLSHNGVCESIKAEPPYRFDIGSL